MNPLEQNTTPQPRRTMSRRWLIGAGAAGLTAAAVATDPVLHFLFGSHKSKPTDVLPPTPTPEPLQKLDSETFAKLVDEYSNLFSANAHVAYQQTLVTGEQEEWTVQEAAFMDTINPAHPVTILSVEKQDMLRQKIIANLYRMQGQTFDQALLSTLQLIAEEVPNYAYSVYLPRALAWVLSLIPQPPFLTNLPADANKPLYAHSDTLLTGSANVNTAELHTVAIEGTHIPKYEVEKIDRLAQATIDNYAKLIALTLQTADGQALYKLAQQLGPALKLADVTTPQDIELLSQQLAQFYFYDTAGTYIQTIEGTPPYTLAEVTQGQQMEKAQRDFRQLEGSNLYIALFLNANYALLQSAFLALQFPPYIFLQTVLDDLFYIALGEQNPDLKLDNPTGNNNLSSLLEVGKQKIQAMAATF